MFQVMLLAVWLVVLQVLPSKAVLLNKESQTKICKDFKITCDTGSVTECLKFIENDGKCERSAQFPFLRRFQNNSPSLSIPGSHIG